MEEQVSVGRIVHYVSYGTPGGEYVSECRAAIITGVTDANDVALSVFSPNGMFFNQSVRRGDTHQGGSWHWPEREVPDVVQ
jgi:hypothetical protein